MRPLLKRWPSCRLLFLCWMLTLASLPFAALAQDATAPVTVPVADSGANASAAPRIGVVTMQPGEIFFERFGHDALVVVDPVTARPPPTTSVTSIRVKRTSSAASCAAR